MKRYGDGVPTKFFPAIKPYNKGYLNVGDGHNIYFEECGNPKGYPILFIHGGPGAGCSKDDRRFFDPKKWRIILHDQRGAGRSQPFCGIRENTTWHLVKDIELLLTELKVDRKVVLFGGSWGSTLSLVYAIAHPERVAGMVLRGIFLATSESMRDYLGGVTYKYYPEVFERFIEQVPDNYKNSPAKYYYKQMTRTKSKEYLERLSYEWAHYELAMLFLKEKSPEALDKVIKSFPYQSLSVLEAHYIANMCFLEDNYIIKNARKIPADAPITIVHGRYDVVCPPYQAWRLAKKLPWAKLHFVTAGHASCEPEIRKMLIAETDMMYYSVK